MNYSIWNVVYEICQTQPLEFNYYDINYRFNKVKRDKEERPVLLMTQNGLSHYIYENDWRWCIGITNKISHYKTPIYYFLIKYCQTHYPDLIQIPLGDSYVFDVNPMLKYELVLRALYQKQKDIRSKSAYHLHIEYDHLHFVLSSRQGEMVFLNRNAEKIYVSKPNWYNESWDERFLEYLWEFIINNCPNLIVAELL